VQHTSSIRSVSSSLKTREASSRQTTSVRATWMGEEGWRPAGGGGPGDLRTALRKETGATRTATTGDNGGMAARGDEDRLRRRRGRSRDSSWNRATMEAGTAAMSEARLPERRTAATGSRGAATNSELPRATGGEDEPQRAEARAGGRRRRRRGRRRRRRETATGGDGSVTGRGCCSPPASGSTMSHEDEDGRRRRQGRPDPRRVETTPTRKTLLSAAAVTRRKRKKWVWSGLEEDAAPGSRSMIPGAALWKTTGLQDLRFQPWLLQMKA
jgi:hypothetical protein